MKHYVIQLGPVTLRRYNLTVHDLVQRSVPLVRMTSYTERCRPVSNAMGARSTATRIGTEKRLPKQARRMWSQADYTSSDRENA